MRHFWFSLGILLLGGWLALDQPAAAQDKKDKKEPPKDKKVPPPPKFTGAGVVFVANGSGDTEHLSEGLREALLDTRTPYATDTIRWSLGLGAARDHRNVERHAEAAGCMVNKVLAFRKANPDRKVVLIGHSSGTHVVLLAAEMLAEKSIDRIILLGSSVACTYDLRGALRAAKSGIDAFWSPEDGMLDYVADLVGTADRKMGVQAAGRVGFASLPPKTPDAKLYGNLRQYKWDYDQARYTPGGKHYGWVHPRFLCRHILPLFMTFEVPAEPAKE